MERQVAAAAVSQSGDLLEEISGVDVNVCPEWRRCASDCPIAYAMDYTPCPAPSRSEPGIERPDSGQRYHKDTSETVYG